MRANCSFEHVSLVAGEGFVITFQEADGDVFDDLRERISHGKEGSEVRARII